MQYDAMPHRGQAVAVPFCGKTVLRPLEHQVRPPIRMIFLLTPVSEHLVNALTAGNLNVTMAKIDTGTAPMRKAMVRQNEFNRLCEQAGLTHQEAAGLLSVSDRTIARYANGSGCPSPLAKRVLGDAARSIATGPRPVSLRFIDLFAGIGGLRVGFQGIGGHCVFTSEWDASAQKTYALNFRDNHPLAGDIRAYAEQPELIPEHDLLVAGFPCQPFSIAGVSKKNALGRPHGFLCDTQGNEAQLQ